ncbi:MAG: endonuclease/exonuclease/phosphatase family protein [Myxococcota bacterium]|nr:endonuclease/exonuclease/phosphatase family protein [Myxococcota bacterium]
MSRSTLLLLVLGFFLAACDDEPSQPLPDTTELEVSTDSLDQDVVPDTELDLEELDLTELELPPDELDQPEVDEFESSPDLVDLDEEEEEEEIEEPVYESPLRIRIMAANTTSGNYQSYDPGHGMRMFQGLKPDIVLIQEFNYNNDTPADIRGMVDAGFGPIFRYRRGRGSIPNGIISRFPIIESGYWTSPETSNRDFDWAIIDIPGERDLLAVSVHLHTDAHNREMDDLADDIRNKTANRDLYIVLGGDFNTSSRSSAENQFQSLLQVGDPYPADEDGVEGTNASRSSPYDWVLVDEDLAELEVPVAIGSKEFPHGLVFDSRVYTPLSDVHPVQEDDSDAPFMQHMPVLRDFILTF